MSAHAIALCYLELVASCIAAKADEPSQEPVQLSTQISESVAQYLKDRAAPS